MSHPSMEVRTPRVQFGRVPYPVLFSDATDAECRLFAYITTLERGYVESTQHFTQAQAAEDLGWSERKVRRVQTLLVEREAIAIQRRPNRPSVLWLLSEYPEMDRPELTGPDRPDLVDGPARSDRSYLSYQQVPTDAAPLSPLLGGKETPSAEVPRSPRARDPIYDALRMAWGERPPALFGKVKRELLATYDDVTPALITARSAEAQRRYEDVSPMVLVNRWPDLAPKRRDAGDVAPKPSKSW